MPRFVLLEHSWNGVHWDLMFEDGPVLKTWSLDTPIVVGVALPARALADHRRAYLDYEGPVSGGRGSVRRLDRGEYETLIQLDGWFRARLDGAQLRGAVEFRRAEGDWTLRFGNFD